MSDSNDEDQTDALLETAAEHASAWLRTVQTRPVGPRATTDELVEVLGGPLPQRGAGADKALEQLATGAEPGLLAIGSGRFFGWVMGGTLPVALAADWLVGAWDQNAGMRHATPATSALEEVAGGWLLALLGLPREADVGFVTGATMASFTGLAAARYAVLARAGWDVHERGLAGAPPVRVLVGEERHDTIDLALRYLGLGRPTAVASDRQGRLRADALGDALDANDDDRPTIVCLQAGHVHSGAFDPFVDAVPLAHQHGAWVHVDGAFGLWAAAAPDLAHLVAGVADADSWATDAHKTLNVPYDCGIAVVRDPVALRSAMGVHAHYLTDADGPGNSFERAPELSRRARGVPVWAALRALGRDGVADLVAGLADSARALADGLAELADVEVLNDVVYTQVCFAVGSDDRTAAVAQRLNDSGEVWVSGSRWAGRAVVRLSVSSAATGADDVRRTVEAVRAAVAATAGR